MAVVIQRFLSAQRALVTMLVLMVLLLTALVLMSKATQNSARFDELYSWLLLSNAAGLLVLALMICHNLYRLLVQYRMRLPGARLTLRLVVIFVLISLAPVSVVYYFSIQFLQRGIDTWFDVQLEQSLEDALELSRTSLDIRTRETLRQTTAMAEELRDVNQSFAAFALDEMLERYDVIELTLFGPAGRIIATSSIDQSAILPNRPLDLVLLHVRKGYDYVSLDPVGAGFQIRALAQIPSDSRRDDIRILQALVQVPQRLSLLAQSAQSGYDRYRRLVFLRSPLKDSFTLTLSLVMLFGILAALWGAVYSARRLVQPIRELAKGTRAVAAGEYDQQVPLSSTDELGFLVQSFNQMTRRLAEAREETSRSQQLVERQRAYLEIVLARLSSGVLTLEQDGRLRTCNAAASQILGIDMEAFVGKSMSDQIEHEQLRHFFELIEPYLSEESGQDWRHELTLFSSTGRQVLMCRGSSLRDSAGLSGGNVIVFDDITALMQAERDAAWAEVARRLAHEIKNPLTPIQLAAERIRHKYLKVLDEEASRVLDRSTHTIVQQVQAMKEMVDAFNEYARPSRLTLIQVDLNELIAEVMYLYRNHFAGIEIELSLDPSNPVIEADTGRLRQLLHNVVKNAIEAIQDGQGSRLVISTLCAREGNADYVQLSVQDNGPGFPESVVSHIFEPYVTTKPKGTGLGLAIVKKIVEEHGGLIRLRTPAEGGACIEIRFPTPLAASEPPPASGDSAAAENTEAPTK
jgi:PAS domain S-box-containing protein